MGRQRYEKVQFRSNPVTRISKEQTFQRCVHPSSSQCIRIRLFEILFGRPKNGLGEYLRYPLVQRFQRRTQRWNCPCVGSDFAPSYVCVSRIEMKHENVANPLACEGWWVSKDSEVWLPAEDILYRRYATFHQLKGPGRDFISRILKFHTHRMGHMSTRMVRKIECCHRIMLQNTPPLVNPTVNNLVESLVEIFDPQRREGSHIHARILVSCVPRGFLTFC